MHVTALIQVVQSSVGSITKTDIQYAQSYECPIYCFRVKRPLRHEQDAIDKYTVPVLYYSHHQHLIDEIEKNMVGEYEKRKKEKAEEAERRTAMENRKSEELKNLETRQGMVMKEEEIGDEEEEEEEDEREEWEKFIEPPPMQAEQQPQREREQQQTAA